MTTSEELKNIVKEKYAEIAVASENKCCCSSQSKIVDYTIMKDEYTNLDGYVKDADLGLGCGLPTEYAGISKGDVVLDLGSGAGNDVFVARSVTGDNGKVIGVDFTQEMIDRALRNKEKLGAYNVEFKLGEIENLPIENNSVDVVISNCVLNLVPSKEKAFGEIYRVLKPGAHFCVSDIVVIGELYPELKKSAALYAGCVAGALQKEEYLRIIELTGFENIEIKKSKVIELPDSLLKKYLSEEQIKNYKNKIEGVFSITVVAKKP